MKEQFNQQNIRNVAIIAHVDHGKTTLIDAFLKQSNTFRDNQQEMQEEMILDSSDLEREKGITITAKNASILYKGYKINIIDTPGHADFGGEVERTINMADGCILLVDAQEGPMPQTKFVLEKAFQRQLKIIVVINKIDKKLANISKVQDKVTDLILSLATDEDQLNFPVLYAIGREGKAFQQLPKGPVNDASKIAGTIEPLLEEIIATIPAPAGDASEPFQMQVCSIAKDDFYGRYLIGKINRGSVKVGDKLELLDSNQIHAKGNVKRLMTYEGLGMDDIQSASAGDIVAIAGIDSTAIGATLCSAGKPEPLPEITITPPSVKIRFEVNTSPFMGKEGEFVTMKVLEKRLLQEKQNNVALNIDKTDDGNYYVSGRGEMQLAILIETLRREGYEFQVRKPEVIYKKEGGKILEPLEEVTIIVPEDHIGLVTSVMSERSGEMGGMDIQNHSATFTYTVLTRNFLGLRSELIQQTKGTAIIHNYLKQYVEKKGDPLRQRNGVLVAMRPGTASGYSLNTIQQRGQLFISPGTEVYEGMIVGINKYTTDLDVDVTKTRHKSAHRIKHDEITQTKLKPIIEVDQYLALSIIADDEVLEVTPVSLRLRKLYLKKTERIWSKRERLTDLAKSQMGINGNSKS